MRAVALFPHTLREAMPDMQPRLDLLTAIAMWWGDDDRDDDAERRAARSSLWARATPRERSQ
jgi:hypothetical protein